MAFAAGWFGIVVSRCFSAFEHLPQEVTLVVWSAACALMLLLVFRLTSRPVAIRAARRRIAGLLLEMWLFGDQPALVWRAQLNLIRANIRYVALLLPAMVVLAAPMFLVWVHLDQLLGRSALAPGYSAVVTAQFREPLSSTPSLETPSGVVVETPAVRLTAERQVCWRIRATGEVWGNLSVRTGDLALEKRVVAGTGTRYTYDRRGSSVADLLLHPGEPALPAAVVIDWIEVGYPEANEVLFGTRWPWSVWFLLLVSAMAIIFSKRFGVSF